MPRTKKRELQWHKASQQWAKRYTDRKTGKKPYVYLGKGTPTRDNKDVRLDHLYEAALAKWHQIKPQIEKENAAALVDQRIDQLESHRRLALDIERLVGISMTHELCDIHREILVWASLAAAPRLVPELQG